MTDITNNNASKNNEELIVKGNIPARLRYVEREEGVLLKPDDSELIHLDIHSTMQDRLAGTIVSEAIWRHEPNINLIMRKAADDEIRAECASFFMSRAVAKVIKNLIAVNTIKPGDAFILQEDLFNAITKYVQSPVAQSVIMEVVNSFLQRCGVVADNGNYTTRTYYPFDAVTTKELADDIAMQEVVRVLSSVDSVSLEQRKYTPATFAAEVATRLEPVGRAFTDVNELNFIIDDIVKGVRAYIDPFHNGFTGAMPAWWKNHEVVRELSHNYVFVTAALQLTPGTTIEPISEGWKLDKWAPLIMAAIRSSRRYAIVGKNEVIRNIGLRKVRDLKDRPVSYVLWRSARPEAVAQAVTYFPDALVPNTLTVTPGKEHIDKSVALAYGNNLAALGTDGAAHALHNFLQDVVSTGYTKAKLGYHIDLGSYHNTSHHEIACLLADRVSVLVDEKGIVQFPATTYGDDFKGADWWYELQTTERDLPLSIGGKLDRTTFYTNRIGEVFISTAEFEPHAPVDPRPQLLAPVSFNSRIHDLDTGIFVPLTTRYAFEFSMMGVKMHGAFRTVELGAMKANPRLSLVLPAYNAEVFQAVQSAWYAMNDMIEGLTKGEDPLDEAIQIHMRRALGRYLLEYSKLISAAFRAEVHDGMVSRAVKDMNPDEAYTMRARLIQKAFGGFADVNALLLFCAMQGIPHDVWKSIAEKNEMATIFMEYQSDRPALSL